jgi:erythronate-4-phosphate dehydrogenase
MKIIVDENIAYAKESFGKIGDVKLMHGREISNSDLQDVDALIIRSITKVDEKLLNNSKIKFVGTATIGTDHVDKDYLQQNGITFADAKGCNANAVVEYVFFAISKWVLENNKRYSDLKLGVVGVGEIGSKVVKCAQLLGMRVLQNDPPRERIEKAAEFVNLDEILESDIITIHTPLTYKGVDATFHLFNEHNLKKIKNNCLFINAARGEIVDNTVLIKELENNNFSVVLDVWENEPEINLSLLKKVLIATPHVAGYSTEGKVNGTKMIYDSLCNYFKIKKEWFPFLPKPQNNIIKANSFNSIEELIQKIFIQIYDINEDSNITKNKLLADKELAGKTFDSLRKNYPLRREFFNYKIKALKTNEQLSGIFKAFRFVIDD